jgi:hypothetical protein
MKPAATRIEPVVVRICCRSWKSADEIMDALHELGYETTVGYDVIDYDNDSSVYLGAVKDGEVSALMDEVIALCERHKPRGDVIDAGALGNGSPDDWSDLFSE